MAHNIEQFADGSSAFFSNREVAWHKLGTVTDGAQTAQDALKIAQLDSVVKVSENYISTTVDGQTITLPDRYLTYRNHPKTGLSALGVVGNRYTPIQNSEAFEFLNHIADESGAVFETAGSLNNGARVFMSMKMPNTMQLAGGQDTVDSYIMATNSHDGTTAFTVAVTPVRVVCTNTVRLALSQAQATIKLRHTAGATAKVQQARETLGLVWKYQEAFQLEVENLISQPFSNSDFKQFVDKLVPNPKEDASQRVKNYALDTRSALTGLWMAPTQQNVVGTKWAAYNAVAEYEDWAKPVRGGENKDVLRAERIVNGGSETLKQKAQLLLV
jgi:phage/plasmid-like protein (TIGR03299 family)